MLSTANSQVILLLNSAIMVVIINICILIYYTAGILAFARPCDIVVDTKEIFGSEGKAQVYAHVHNLLSRAVMKDIS